MIAPAFSALADRTPPAWVRKFEAAALMGVLAEAFGVDPPALGRLNADEALQAFREFSAACMEAALADTRLARRCRARLGAGARKLGVIVRRVLAVHPSQAFSVARYFYRGIGIALEGELPGGLRFGPCSFSQRYTPADCWFMSAFDEGFMRGITRDNAAALVFDCRITEGAPCCSGRFCAGKEA